MLPSAVSNAWASRRAKFRRSVAWPARTPVNASRTSSRTAAHDSGPMWLVRPSSQWTFTICLPPVSPAHTYPLLDGAHGRNGCGKSGYEGGTMLHHIAFSDGLPKSIGIFLLLGLRCPRLSHHNSCWKVPY